MLTFAARAWCLDCAPPPPLFLVGSEITRNTRNRRRRRFVCAAPADQRVFVMCSIMFLSFSIPAPCRAAQDSLRAKISRIRTPRFLPLSRTRACTFARGVSSLLAHAARKPHSEVRFLCLLITTTRPGRRNNKTSPQLFQFSNSSNSTPPARLICVLRPAHKVGRIGARS